MRELDDDDLEEMRAEGVRIMTRVPPKPTAPVDLAPLRNDMGAMVKVLAQALDEQRTILLEVVDKLGKRQVMRLTAKVLTRDRNNDIETVDIQVWG